MIGTFLDLEIGDPLMQYEVGKGMARLEVKFFPYFRIIFFLRLCVKG